MRFRVALGLLQANIERELISQHLSIADTWCRHSFFVPVFMHPRPPYHLPFTNLIGLRAPPITWILIVAPKIEKKCTHRRVHYHHYPTSRHPPPDPATMRDIDHPHPSGR